MIHSILILLQLAGFPSTDTRSVDFDNFTYRVDGQRITVKNGDWVKDDETGKAYLVVADIQDGDLTGDGASESAILLESYGGGNGFYTSMQVFSAATGRPKVIATLEGGDRDDGGIKRCGIQQGQLWVVRIFRDCAECSTSKCDRCFVTTFYRWDGKHLKATKRVENLELPDAPN
ncbi:MAG: hypothetical protein WC538_07480 [Thermoanaerobaculia bacterium]|jgi:hypothetical protein